MSYFLGFKCRGCEVGQFRWYLQDVFQRERTYMSRWRNRLLVGLIIYFAGFATAVYALAPASGKAWSFGVVESSSKGHGDAESRSEKFALKFNGVMHKFLGFAEGKAAEVSEAIKTKIAEHKEGGEK